MFKDSAKIVKFSAFTLAEVLITLGIIGIVAAMTVPTLMNNAQDAQFKSAWKKQYSALSQATASIISDNGSFKGIGTMYQHSKLRDLYADKLRYIKSCADNTSFGDCWIGGTYSAPLTKYLNGNTLPNMDYFPLGSGSAGLVLADGTFVIFAYQDPNCTSNSIPGPGSEGLSNICGWVSVDVNGAKGPNTVGKDIFGVWVLDNKISPYGTQNYANSCNTSSTGISCSSQYLSQ